MVRLADMLTDELVENTVTLYCISLRASVSTEDSHSSLTSDARLHEQHVMPSTYLSTQTEAMNGSVYEIKTDVGGVYIQDYTVWYLRNTHKKSYVVEH
jgi:hypothetical protein